MAIFTSHNGYFEVEAISFSPNVITMDEETEYSITIKNTSGKNISRLIMKMDLRFIGKDGDAHSSDDVLVFGDYPLETSIGYWNAGKSVTFTGKFKLTSFYELDNASRVLPIYKGNEVGYGDDRDVGLVLTFSTDAIFSNMTNHDSFYNLRGANSEYLTVLDARYKPSIPVFAAERTTDGALDDEGESLLAGVRLASSDAAIADRMKLRLSYGSTQNDLSEHIESALAGEIVTTLPGTFDKNADWPLMLWFGDDYESASVTIEVPKAFANVHLSGASTGGVCFGSFSKATEGNPSFQCYYPSTFYAGIDGVTNYAAGEVATGGKWIDGKPIYRTLIHVDVAANANQIIGTISDLDTLIRMDGAFKWANGFWLPITHYFSADNYHQVYLSGNDVYVQTVAALTGYVLLEYTKT